ncbi:MAG: PIN domain protein, partial [Elusimicrobiota bacterium]
RNDARHVAYATCLRVDILVTFNLEHMANEWSARKFNSVNLKEGYSTLTIRTPEEVIHYGY